MQLIQNASARVLTKIKKVDHIQFSDLYTDFLSVKQLILELLLLVYKSLHDLWSKYFDLLLHYEPSRPLRSSETDLLSLLRVKTTHGLVFMLHISEQTARKLHVCCNSVFLNQG